MFINMDTTASTESQKCHKTEEIECWNIKTKHFKQLKKLCANISTVYYGLLFFYVILKVKPHFAFKGTHCKIMKNNKKYLWSKKKNISG